MNRRSCIFILLLAFFAQGVLAQALTIASYNIRYDNPRDSGNLWVNRAPVVASLIRFHDFDIMGTQEGLKHQLDDLRKALPEYEWYGVGRDDGKEKGEFSAIFYKKAKFRVLQKGDFWLSPTPEKPGPGWDARLNRICSWLQLQDIKTKKTFFIFNVHYDHQGVQARKESSKLLLEKIRTIAGNQPAILTGDFNGGHNSEWYQLLENSDVLQDTYKQVKEPYLNNSSFNGFGTSFGDKEIIDHIFVTRQFQAAKWGLLTDTYFGKFPSDHFPVVVRLNWK